MNTAVSTETVQSVTSNRAQPSNVCRYWVKRPRTSVDWDAMANIFESGCHSGCLSPHCKSASAERKNAERRELIAGNRPDDLRRVAEKFVEEAENAVSHQVDVKMLAGQDFL